MNLKSSIKNVYFHEENGRPVWCYRSGMTVYEECLFDGRLLSYGMNAAGYPQNIVEGSPTRPDDGWPATHDVFDFEINGITANHRLSLVSFETAEEERENGTKYTHARLTLKPAHLNVNVTVHTELDGTPVIIRYLEIANLGGEKVNVGNITPLSGLIDEIRTWQSFMETPDVSKMYSLGYMESSRHNNEGLFAWHDLNHGGTSILGRYTVERYRHPAFFLRNNITGSIFNLQLAFTGGYEFHFNLEAVGNIGFMKTEETPSRLEFACRIKSPNPQKRLAAGEGFITPTVHFSRVFGSLDDSVNSMHEHIRKSVFVLPAPGGKRGVVAAGFGCDRPMDMRMVRHFVKTAKAIGAEYIIIDAGWYCPPDKYNEWYVRAGDWQFDRDLYPGGGLEVADCIHEAGLKFGLWIEPERMGRDSQVAKDHPEWRGTHFKRGKLGDIIDMSKPDAVEWVESEIARVIEENKVDLFRLDYNIGSAEIFCQDEDGVCNTLSYYENVYAMYNRLRKRFPNVVFENCAGGGGRTDLGMMRNFNHTWVSDHQIAPRSFAITNGMTMVLPPEYVDRLCSGMSCHIRGSLDFQVRQTLFGKPTSNSYYPFDSEPNEEMLAFVKHSYDIYNKYMRPYIDEGRIYHHTPEISSPMPTGNGIIERSDSSRSRSVIGVFRLANTADKEDIVVYPRGIDPSGSYRVVYDNEVLMGGSSEGSTVDGYKLVNEGIRVRLADSITSELIIIEKA